MASQIVNPDDSQLFSEALHNWQTQNHDGRGFGELTPAEQSAIVSDARRRTLRNTTSKNLSRKADATATSVSESCEVASGERNEKALFRNLRPRPFSLRSAQAGSACDGGELEHHQRGRRARAPRP